MKLLDQVLEFNIHEIVKINEMPFGFVPGGITTHAIFDVRQLQENYINYEC